MTEGKSAIPPWAGKLPFGPDEKRPVRFKHEDCLTKLYGKEDHKVLTGTYLSTDKLSCSSFRTPPGGYFEPYDIHGGDEVYYVAQGGGVAFNPHTGLAYPLKTGDMLWIPQGVWHQFYNFGPQESYVATAFAPKMWTDMGTRVTFDGEPLLLKGKGIDWQDLPRLPDIEQEYSIKLGAFPAHGPTARKSQEMFVISPDKAINLIQGQDSRMLVSFFVSNDFIHAGTITLPCKIESELDCHKGDKLMAISGFPKRIISF